MYVYSSDDETTYPRVAQAGDRLFYVGRLAECLSQLALFATLLELGLGILRAHDGGRSVPGWHRAARIGGFAIVTLLGALELTHFGLAQRFYTDLYGPSGLDFYMGAPPDAKVTVLHARRVYMSFISLLFVLSVGLSAFAIMVRMRVGQASRVRAVSLLSTILCQRPRGAR